MSRILRTVPVVFAVIGLTACSQGVDVDRAVDPLNVIDQTNLSDVMLNAASPDEAVAYFQRTLAEQPDRIDMKRGLAKSLVRAGRAAEALPLWAEIVADPRSTNEDRMEYADALIRNGDWDAAEAQLDLIPPTLESFERYRLEAMVADSNREWDRAESFYETAVGLTTRPAGVLNNWGFSRLTRGDHAGAEELFLEAISYDPNLFTAKNNLVLARAAQGNYQLPLVRMTQSRTRAASAHRRAGRHPAGQISTGRNLLSEAIDTHPQHFEAAVRALRALEQDA
jgi:Flp pilus assembly protein TadD